MNWLSSNWIWVALALGFVALHLVGHRGHGYAHRSHGHKGTSRAAQSKRDENRQDATNVANQPLSAPDRQASGDGQPAQNKASTPEHTKSHSSHRHRGC